MLSKSGDSKTLSLNCIILVFELSTIVFFRVPFITYLRVTNHRRDICTSTCFKTDTLTFRSGKKKREVIKHQLVYSKKEMKKYPLKFHFRVLKNYSIFVWFQTFSIRRYHFLSGIRRRIPVGRIWSPSWPPPPSVKVIKLYSSSVVVWTNKLESLP